MNKSFSNSQDKRFLNSGRTSQVATARKREKASLLEEVERRFREAIREPINQAVRIGEADIVVGIPFYNEVDTIKSVLKTVRRGLEKFYPNQKCVIVAAGSPVGGKALRVINAFSQNSRINQIAFVLNDERLNGKGWCVLTLMEIARILGADLAIVEADLRSRVKNGEIEGLAPDWINLLLEPIRQEKMDLVISRFNRHYFEFPTSTHLIYPLITAIYNYPIHDLQGGQWGISHRLLRTYLQAPWNIDAGVGGYGIDSWLATKAITNGARICEANLGIKLHRPSVAKIQLVFREVAETLFEQIMADKEWWIEEAKTAQSSLLIPLATFGAKKSHKRAEVKISAQHLVSLYKQGFNKYHSLYNKVLPEATYRQLEKLAATETESFVFPPPLWAQIVYCFLTNFGFRKEFARGDLLNAFMPLSYGLVAGFAVSIQTLKAKLETVVPDEAESLASLEAQRQIEEIIDEFLRQRPHFLATWERKEEALESPVPKVTYREFIPGVPLVVPSELTAADGKVIASANGIYDSIFPRYENEFKQFVYERLQVSRDANSLEIVGRVRDFMHETEREIDKILLPGDLSTVEGTRDVVEAIFGYFPHEDNFALLPDMISWLVRRYPPTNLLTKLDYNDVATLLNEYEPNDVLALANWSEEQDYMQHLWGLMKENARVEHFGPCVLKPLVVNHEEYPSLLEMKESFLDKISCRIVVSNLRKGMGGELPKLSYFTHIAKNITEARRFGRVWQRFAEERRGFGEKIINSLEGHWGREPLSAHNIFENGHQRALVAQLKEIAQQITQEAGKDAPRLTLAEHLRDVADSYHLAVTLPDGTFIPCSAWTWASYSYKGGKGVPTPLSLHVERDWYSREFLTEYFKAGGGDEEAIEKKIMQLMEEGREWEDLSPILLGSVKGAEKIVPEQTITIAQPIAGDLTRFAENPILEPIIEHTWESKCVLNPGVIKLKGKIYLVYRAVGEDDISRLGLAVSEDGFRFTDRLGEPIFEPKTKDEEKGCEDPRLTLIGDRVYMVYTAYDGIVAQIALASINVNDFLDYRWGAWHRHGLVFPGFTDKDGTLFPEYFDGKFAMLHRVDPHIWITLSSHLRCPWSRKRHKILAGAASGMMWDGKKIGAGAQPIKTKYGWLLVTHGVDYAHVYRLGLILLDLADPTTVLYRSPNPILEPTATCEVGEVGKCWVHNVVFTCGAVPQEDNKKILDAEDELLVYYGAADTRICLATAKIGDLIPAEVSTTGK